MVYANIKALLRFCNIDILLRRINVKKKGVNIKKWSY